MATYGEEEGGFCIFCGQWGVPISDGVELVGIKITQEGKRRTSFRLSGEHGKEVHQPHPRMKKDMTCHTVTLTGRKKKVEN